MAPSSPENEALYRRVCELLEHHSKPRDNGEDTLNRLFRKHLNEHLHRFADNPPRLTVRNVSVALDTWSKERLSDIAPSRIRSREPDDPNAELVLVRYLDQQMLIDGGSRISKWRREGLTGTHDVYVLTVHN